MSNPLDRWKREKARLEAEKAGKLPEDSEELTEESALDSSSKLTPLDRYKKRGESCEHPPDMIVAETGKILGKVRVCTACGTVLTEDEE